MRLNVLTICSHSKSDLEALIYLGGWTIDNFGYWVDHTAFTMRNEIRKIEQIKKSDKWNNGNIPQHTKSGLELRLESAKHYRDAAEQIIDTMKWKRPTENRPTTKKDLNELFESVISEVAE